MDKLLRKYCIVYDINIPAVEAWLLNFYFEHSRPSDDYTLANRICCEMFILLEGRLGMISLNVAERSLLLKKTSVIIGVIEKMLNLMP